MSWRNRKRRAHKRALNRLGKLFAQYYFVPRKMKLLTKEGVKLADFDLSGGTVIQEVFIYDRPLPKLPQ